MSEEGVTLEDGVDWSFVWWDEGNILTIEKDLTACWHIKSSNHSEGGCLATPRRSKEGDELTAFDIEIEVIDSRERLVKNLADIL
jgi:hypothetical protein